eukprot:TCALIF_11502-PA protein Name:"Protein of unknown function" AED:0.28 eAED:0.28 QI:282/0.33/0.5/0.75/0.66/0.5/4/231/325
MPKILRLREISLCPVPRPPAVRPRRMYGTAELKISFGPKTSSSSLSSISSTWAASAATPTPPTPPIGSPGRRRVSVSHETQSGAPAEEESGRKRRRRKSQDEEEKWLDAVEAGNMTAVDPELKSIKDPKLMTARQRAMVEKQKVVVPEAEDSFSPVPMTAEGGHMALDYGYKKKELDTEESLQLKAIKSQKRKVIEMEKRENDKKKTMDRLLKKKDSKAAARQTKSVKCLAPNHDPEVRVLLETVEEEVVPVIEESEEIVTVLGIDLRTVEGPGAPMIGKPSARRIGTRSEKKESAKFNRRVCVWSRPPKFPPSILKAKPQMKLK